MSVDTYYESAQGVVISAKRAMKELRFHGVDTNDADLMADFYDFCGVADGYHAARVLDWLGY